MKKLFLTALLGLLSLSLYAQDQYLDMRKEEHKLALKETLEIHNYKDSTIKTFIPARSNGDRQIFSILFKGERGQKLTESAVKYAFANSSAQAFQRMEKSGKYKISFTNKTNLICDINLGHCEYKIDFAKDKYRGLIKHLTDGNDKLNDKKFTLSVVPFDAVQFFRVAKVGTYREYSGGGVYSGGYSLRINFLK